MILEKKVQMFPQKCHIIPFAVIFSVGVSLFVRKTTLVVTLILFFLNHNEKSDFYLIFVLTFDLKACMYSLQLTRSGTHKQQKMPSTKTFGTVRQKMSESRGNSLRLKFFWFCWHF